MNLSPLVLVSAVACGWNNLPRGGSSTLEQATWDPASAVTSAGGLYVRLPQAGALVRLAPGEEPALIDVGEGRVTRMAGSPDGTRLVAFVEKYFCTSDNPDDVRGVDTPEECPADALVVETSLRPVAGTTVDDGLDVAGTYNAIAFSDDGSFGIAYVDFTQDIVVDGVLNLTGIVVFDFQAGTSTLVPVGFAADRVLFTNDASGRPVQAVVLSRNAVAVVDLVATPPAVVVTFPLTLDPDVTVEPTSVDLTPDGRYALISTAGSSDLYALDLEQHAINIVELSGVPAELAVSDANDRTVLVYGSRRVVELLDHDFFDIQTFDLDEPMNHVVLAGANAVLYGTADQHDLYRFDFENEDVIEYRLQNPAVSLHLSPDQTFAIALTRAEGFGGTGIDALYDQNPGMEILDLRSDASEAFLLEGQGVGIAFAQTDTSLSALVLQEGFDYLYKLELYTGATEEITLSAPPVAIGTMPNGDFWITHDSALGLVSFLDPSSGNVEEIGGFATLGLFDPIEIIEEAAP